MNEPITLKRGNMTAVIDLEGAWLTRFQAAGQDILFPRQTFTLPDGSTKLRGGSHVCFPNFGPGGDSGLPQHGYARASAWSVVEHTDGGVELILGTQPGIYADVEARLTYELLENGVSMALRVTNRGNAEVSICPAFHPYFATKAEASTVQGREYMHADLAKAVFVGGTVTSLESGAKRFALQEQNLPQWVLWTDGLGSYVCLEPTAAGNGFEDGTALQLQPGDEWRGSLNIQVNEREK